MHQSFPLVILALLAFPSKCYWRRQQKRERERRGKRHFDARVIWLQAMSNERTNKMHWGGGHAFYFRWLRKSSSMIFVLLRLRCNFPSIYQQSNCHWQCKQSRAKGPLTRAKSQPNSIRHPSSDTPVKLSTNLLPEAAFILSGSFSFSSLSPSCSSFLFFHWLTLCSEWPAHLALFDICFPFTKRGPALTVLPLTFILAACSQCILAIVSLCDPCDFFFSSPAC